MIILFLVTMIYSLVKLLLAVIPDLPPVPSAFSDPLGFLAQFIGSGVGIVQYIMSPPLFMAMVLVGGFLLAFDFLWAMFWFILRKVPFANQIRQ